MILRNVHLFGSGLDITTSAPSPGSGPPPDHQPQPQRWGASTSNAELPNHQQSIVSPQQLSGSIPRRKSRGSSRSSAPVRTTNAAVTTSEIQPSPSGMNTLLSGLTVRGSDTAEASSAPSILSGLTVRQPSTYVARFGLSLDDGTFFKSF